MVGMAAERIGRGGASGWLHAEDSRTKVGIIFELYVGFFLKSLIFFKARGGAHGWV